MSLRRRKEDCSAYSNLMGRERCRDGDIDGEKSCEDQTLLNLPGVEACFGEIVEGVDRAWSRVFFEILENPQWKFHVAMTLTGAQVTAQSRHLMDSTVSPMCPYCHQEEESQEHRMSECCHFQGRQRQMGC